MVRAKVSLDRSKLTKIYDQKKRLIRKNILAVLKKEALPNLVNLIMIGYDTLSERMEILPDDPTNPELWREEFKLLLERELEDTVFIDNDSIRIRMGDKDVLGYTEGELIGPEDDTPLHWLVYYLEGLAGDWAFLSPENYETITGHAYNPEWGRFHQGFMISREEYTDKGWDKVIPFNELRHPFSGFSPLDIFKVALDEFTLRPFIEKAVTAAAKGQKL